MEEYYQNLISNKYHPFEEKFKEVKSKEEVILISNKLF